MYLLRPYRYAPGMPTQTKDCGSEVCRNCGQEFTKRSPKQHFCPARECRRAQERDYRMRQRAPKPDF
jgi:arginyl-tRNA--protein-N-Asp/Glu arginylyltransferase